MGAGIKNRNLRELSGMVEKCSCGETHSLWAFFYFGDFVAQLSVLFQRFCAGGTAALVTEKNTLLSYGKKLKDVFDSENVRYITVVADENREGGVWDDPKLFALPENVRCVVYLDGRLGNLCSYFCSCREIPLVFVPTDFCIDGTLARFYRNGYSGQEDSPALETERHIIVDENLINAVNKRSLADAYAETVSRAVALIDYKISEKLKDREVCREAFSLAKQSVADSVNILNYKEKAPVTLLCNAFKLQIADSFLNDALLRGSSVELTFDYLKRSVKNLSPAYKLTVAFRILGLYALFFENLRFFPSKMTDYAIRAEKLSKKTGIPEDRILRFFEKNADKYDGCVKKLYALRENVLNDVNGLLSKSEALCSVYAKLGSADERDFAVSPSLLKEAVYRACDYPFYYSAHDLLRDSGLLEELTV